MLTGICIHPQLMGALALCGHGDKILIADGNYPLASKTGQAKKIYLGLAPGLPSVTDVLRTIQSVVNLEKAEVMQPEDGSEPEVFPQFRYMLGGIELEKLGRFEFYDACQTGAVRVAISTGDKRTYANLLLTIGVG